MRKQRIELRRPKLPPLLEIDEDGLPVHEREGFAPPRPLEDDESTSVTLEDWPPVGVDD